MDQRNSPLERLAKLFAWLGVAALVAIMLLTFADVIGRTLFARALVGTVETVTMLMGVLVFLGLAWTEVVRRHVKVDTFLEMAPSTLRLVLNLFNSVLASLVACALLWRLLLQTLDQISEGETTQIWSIPFWPTAVTMSVGMSLFVVVLLVRVWRDAQHLFGDGK